ncbi:MAG TPA: hypothetical protein VLA77_01290 [Candidatus Saccharimonadales bacterium]|nr:hypothetical protein [Candidatus Saccharimonadales bacterium]
MTYLNAITPINISEEKHKFFNNSNYQPQLEYNWDEKSIEGYKRVSPLFSDLVDAMVAQDVPQIHIYSREYFDVDFRPQDLEFAANLIRRIPEASNGTADELAKIFQSKLDALNIDYKVEVVDKHGFQCRPNHPAKKVEISKYLHLQFLSTEGVASHELVHVIRAVNGDHNGIAIQHDYLPTEEGLSCLIQDELLKEPSASSFQHALEFLAADLSSKASFKEVFDFLVSMGADEESAWLRGIRQKFGVKDTSKPGSLMKSGMYFYHERLLSELSKQELARLFVGKIPQHHLSNYPKYSGVVPEEKILELLG